MLSGGGVACPNCHTLNPGGAKYCGTCGQPMVAPRPAMPVPPPGPLPPVPASGKPGKPSQTSVLVAAVIIVSVIVVVAALALRGLGPSGPGPSGPGPSGSAVPFSVWPELDRSSGAVAFWMALPQGWSATGDFHRDIYNDPYFVLDAIDASGMMHLGFGMPYEEFPGSFPDAASYIQNQLVPELSTKYANLELTAIANRPDRSSQTVVGPIVTTYSEAGALLSFTLNGAAYVGGVEVIFAVITILDVPTTSHVYLSYAYAPQAEFKSVMTIYNACLPTVTLNVTWAQAELSSEQQWNQAMFQAFAPAAQPWATGEWNVLGGTQEWGDSSGTYNLPTAGNGCYWRDVNAVPITVDQVPSQYCTDTPANNPCSPDHTCVLMRLASG